MSTLKLGRMTKVMICMCLVVGGINAPSKSDTWKHNNQKLCSVVSKFVVQDTKDNAEDKHIKGELKKFFRIIAAEYNADLADDVDRNAVLVTHLAKDHSKFFREIVVLMNEVGKLSDSDIDEKKVLEVAREARIDKNWTHKPGIQDFIYNLRELTRIDNTIERAVPFLGKLRGAWEFTVHAAVAFWPVALLLAFATVAFILGFRLDRTYVRDVRPDFSGVCSALVLLQPHWATY